MANEPTVHSFPRLKLPTQATTYLHFRQRYTRGSGFTVISDGSAFTTSIQLCGKILAKKEIKTKLFNNTTIFWHNTSKVITVHSMKVYGEGEVSLHSFLIPALQGGEQSASSLDYFTPWESTHRHHWLRGWVGPSVSLGILEKRKFPYSCQELKLWCPGCVACRLVSMLTETSWLQHDRYKTQQHINSNKCHMLEHTAEDTIYIIHRQTWKQHKIGEKIIQK